MIRWLLPSLALFLALSLPSAAQQSDDPTANPGRPTIATPATLTPVGYLQFETGYLGAWHSPEFSSQSSINEVMKFSVSHRIELLVADEPFAHTRSIGQATNATGGVSLGVQGVLSAGEGSRPTFAVSYFRQVYGGNAADLDIGSAHDSLLLLASADVKGFHYDANLFFNKVDDGAVRRGQFGQTISLSHPLGKDFGLTSELWHFSQPFLQSNAVGSLWALDYNASKILVFDAGFDAGLTGTSTRWELFAGVSYLLPHNLLPHLGGRRN